MILGLEGVTSDQETRLTATEESIQGKKSIRIDVQYQIHLARHLNFSIITATGRFVFLGVCMLTGDTPWSLSQVLCERARLFPSPVTSLVQSHVPYPT